MGYDRMVRNIAVLLARGEDTKQNAAGNAANCRPVPSNMWGGGGSCAISHSLRTNGFE